MKICKIYICLLKGLHQKRGIKHGALSYVLIWYLTHYAALMSPQSYQRVSL